MITEYIKNMEYQYGIMKNAFKIVGRHSLYLNQIKT